MAARSAAARSAAHDMRTLRWLEMLLLVRAGPLDRLWGPRSVMVVVAGSNRGGPPTWESIHEHLLVPLRADLTVVLPAPWIARLRDAAYLATAPASEHAAKLLLLDAAKLVVPVPEIDDWGDLSAGRKAELRQKAQAVAAAGGPLVARSAQPAAFVRGVEHAGSGAIVNAYRWFAKDALGKAGLLQAYAWYVYMRTDTYVLCPVPGFDWRPPEPAARVLLHQCDPWRRLKSCDQV
ncbi:hypothetical protein T492DRAFT_855700 [Pavlovales sp. CCMP2436]|nr:hypothetical protein T492DRAFT_855700 [Pavlovales sp. CCMP2436]